VLQVITDELQAVLHKLEGDDMSWEEHERDANLMIRELLRVSYHHVCLSICLSYASFILQLKLNCTQFSFNCSL